MSTYESGIRGDRRTGRVKFVSDVADAEGISRPMGSIGRAHFSRPAEFQRGGAFSAALLGVSRLIFPVLLLITAAAAAMIYGSQPVLWLGNVDVGGKPLDAGFLVLPLMFFIVQLTNRRYGAAYAFAQVVGGALLAVGAALYLRDDLTLLRGGAFPELRLIAAFGTGLFAAQLLSILVFDRLRGPRWWNAPLYASFLGGIALSLIAYPAAYAGTGVEWMQPMMIFMGICAAASIMLLVPYWALRSMVAPLPGFGGY